MGNIKIRYLPEASSTEVYSGNLLAVALDTDGGYAKITKSFNFNQIVLGGSGALGGPGSPFVFNNTSTEQVFNGGITVPGNISLPGNLNITGRISGNVTGYFNNLYITGEDSQWHQVTTGWSGAGGNSSPWTEGANGVSYGGDVGIGGTLTVDGRTVPGLQPSINDGDMILYSGQNTTDINPKPFLMKAYVGRNTPETTFLQESYVTFQTILDTFYRFSHWGNWDHTNQNLTEKTNWSPSNLSDVEGGWGLGNPSFPTASQLNQSVNSGPYIGFASVQATDNYEASTVLQVTHGGADEDVIGWVIAMEKSGGVDYDLSVVRSLSTPQVLRTDLHGAQYSWGIAYNFGKTDEMWIKGDNGPGQKTSWISQSGSAVKITRTPTSVTVQLADLGARVNGTINIDPYSKVPVDSSPLWGNELTVDLTASHNRIGRGATDGWTKASLSISDMDIFTKQCKWGLSARSQPYCSWADLFFKGANAAFVNPSMSDYIFNTEDNTTWEIDNFAVGGPAWVEVASPTLESFVDNGQAVYDVGNSTLFFKQEGVLQPLLSDRPSFVNKASDFTVAPDMLGKMVYLTGVSNITVSHTLSEGFNCKFINQSTTNITMTPTNGATINGGAAAAVIPAGRSFELLGNGLADGKGVTIMGAGY